MYPDTALQKIYLYKFIYAFLHSVNEYTAQILTVIIMQINDITK